MKKAEPHGSTLLSRLRPPVTIRRSRPPDLPPSPEHLPYYLADLPLWQGSVVGVETVPVDFIARLAALVPKPRVNLTRYHGVLAPNHRWRGEVTPAKRGKALKMVANAGVKTPAECYAAMTWAQRLKRVFNIDIETCGRCGGWLKVIACIEEQDITTLPLLTPPPRAPPETR
jgi:hypothetical protein